MPGSTIVIDTGRFVAGWASLQADTSLAWQRLDEAATVHDLATTFTALSRHRLLAFCTLTLHRAQRLERLTAGALLSDLEFGLLADKDVDAYRRFRLVPYVAPVREILAAVTADVDLLRAKCAKLGLDLSGQLGAPGGALPRRTALFFGLRPDPANPHRLIRVRLAKGDVDTLAKKNWGRPANVGRHFLINALLAARLDVSTVATATGHAHIGAESFSDSTGVAPAAVHADLRRGLTSVVAGLGLMAVAGPFGTGRVAQPARAPAPRVATDPYVTPRLDAAGRVLPSPFDPHTLPALAVVSHVWRVLTERALLKELGPAEGTLCAVALDGIHPQDLAEACAAQGIGKSACLTFRRAGCHAEISLPLCARTILAIQAHPQAHIGSDTQFAAVGRWLQQECGCLAWPEHPQEAFLAFYACAARFHRFHGAPAVLAAASRALPAAAANRRSMLRLAAKSAVAPVVVADFVPVRIGASRQRVRSRAALAQIQRALSAPASIRAAAGEEQARARKLDGVLAHIDIAGDLPAQRAVEALRAECALWLDPRQRAAKAGRQFSSLYTYASEIFVGLRMLAPGEDLSTWDAPDFVDWQARVAAAQAEPGDSAPKLFGLRRFLLMGRDHLQWDVPDALVNGESPLRADPRRRSAAASLILAGDYAVAEAIVRRRLAEWPRLLEAALLELELRRHVSSRTGERVTLAADCLTPESARLVLRNAGYSDKKSRNSIRLSTVPPALAQAIRMRSAVPDATGETRTHLFLDSKGEDWTTADAVHTVVTDALVAATGDATLRAHSSRAAAACALAFSGWEAAARTIFTGHGVAGALSWPRPESPSAVVRTAIEMGVGHARTFLTYYCPIWPVLRAVEVNRLLAAHPPTPAFIAAALGDTQTVRAARSRARQAGEAFSAWDAIGRLAADRAALQPLEETSLPPVFAPAAQAAGFPAANTLARYVLARSTGTPRDVAAQEHGIPIHLANHIDSHLENPTHD